ncbi:MAG: hypothetical protein ACXVI6_02075 [Candidatus Aminicenantales bacterium]
MKKLMILVTAMIVLIPVLAYSDMMTVRLGYYMPSILNSYNYLSHPNSLWGIELSQMSFVPSDFRGGILGGGYEFFLTKQVSIALSVDGFSREAGGFYKDYVGIALDNADFQGNYAFPAADYTGDFEVLHSFRVSMTPVQLSLKLTPLGRKTRLIPYVGGGVGVYFVSASIGGSIVDFSSPSPVTDPDRPELGSFDIYPVVPVQLHESRTVIGGHAFAGLMFPIGYRLTLEGEARYHFAKVKFQHAFPYPDFDAFDLSGLSLSVGLNYWF